MLSWRSSVENQILSNTAHHRPQSSSYAHSLSFTSLKLHRCVSILPAQSPSRMTNMLPLKQCVLYWMMIFSIAWIHQKISYYFGSEAGYSKPLVTYFLVALLAVSPAMISRKVTVQSGVYYFCLSLTLRAILEGTQAADAVMTDLCAPSMKEWYHLRIDRSKPLWIGLSTTTLPPGYRGDYQMVLFGSVSFVFLTIAEWRKLSVSSLPGRSICCAVRKV